ncbi:MAG: prepilin-type N-terminal cleavage/methylation domain-containing protein [Pseudomonadota bacterium]
MIVIKKTLGFTLVELVIAISIAGVVFTGVLSAAAYLVSRSSDPLLIQQSIHVGEAYIAEIIARDFEAPSLACSNEATLLIREEYSKICHYDGLNNTSVENQVGEAVTELAAYSVLVEIAESADLGPVGEKIANTDAVLISVTVTAPDGNTLTLSVYRTNAYG